jgi:hypothetical protein
LPWLFLLPLPLPKIACQAKTREEEDFTEDQTNRFPEIYSANPSRNQQQQDNGNPAIRAIREDPSSAFPASHPHPNRRRTV